MNSMRYIIIFFLLMFGFSSDLYSATVIKVSKKRRKVTIDEGSEQGLSKKQRICFYKSSGKKVGCGKIVKVKKNKAYVKVSKKRIKKIKKGMTAALKGAKKSSNKIGNNPYRLKVSYVLSAITPAAFQKVAFNEPAAGETSVSSLWTQNGFNNKSFFGFGFEFDIPISTYSLGVGLRTRTYQEFNADSNYTNDFTKYAQVTQVGDSKGLFIDFNYLSFGSILLGSGLDVDLLSMTMQSAVISEGDGSSSLFAEASGAGITTISLRFRVQYFLDFASFGISPSLTLMVPVSASPTGTYTSTEENFKDKLTDITPDEDLEQSIALSKSSFGAEIYIGAYLNF